MNRRAFLTSGLVGPGIPRPKGGPTCKTCFYWGELDRETATKLGITEKYNPGLCHYNAPTAQGFGRSFDVDWCRLHKEKNE